jgi:hypothetical protein
MREMRNTYKIKVRKFERKKLIERSRNRLMDDIKMYPKEEGDRMQVGSIWLRIGTSG